MKRHTFIVLLTLDPAELEPGLVPLLVPDEIEGSLGGVGAGVVVTTVTNSKVVTLGIVTTVLSVVTSSAETGGAKVLEKVNAVLTEIVVMPGMVRTVSTGSTIADIVPGTSDCGMAVTIL